MADEKLNTGAGEQKIPEAPEPVAADPAPAPDLAAEPAPAQEQAGPAQPEPGDVTISADQIDKLMAEKRQAARAEIEKEGDPPVKESEAPAAEHPTAGGEEPQKPRRGRPPRAEKAEQAAPGDKKEPKTSGPPARPSRHNETKCPEVGIRQKSPKRRKRNLLLKSPLHWNRPGLPSRSRHCRPVPLKRASWSI